MSFIGVICESRNENYINQILIKNLEKENIIFLKEESIDNLKNIKFETIIIMANNEKLFAKKDVVKNIISKAKYLIINADEEIDLKLLENININVITYGFNSKSTITTSSVKEDTILLCVQRNIQDINGKEIEPQEIIVEKEEKTATSVIIGIGTILLLYGKNSKKLEKINFLCRQNQKNIV